MAMIRFRATIKIVGVNPYVDLPARVTRHFGKRGYVPVTVHLESGQVASTLVPVGGGAHRLYINGQMLRCTTTRVGHRLSVGLELDTRDRSWKTPDQLAAALAARPIAEARWRALRPSKRKEAIRYLLSGKTETTRSRNTARLLRILGSKSGKGSLCGIQIEAHPMGTDM